MNGARNNVDDGLCIARVGVAGHGQFREWVCEDGQALSGGVGGLAWIVDRDIGAALGQVSGITDPEK